MSATGIIFDIKELAVFDGPGIRTTVFLKGCPMRCRWCHNPEGLDFKPQLMVSDNGCAHCGSCMKVCPVFHGSIRKFPPYPDGCISCGKCVRECPARLRRIAGTPYTAEKLADKLLRNRQIFEMNHGGITLSGGEPVSQPLFVIELLDRLSSVNRAIETSGYAEPQVFQEILRRLDFVQMDLKLIDPVMHRKWTGRENDRIIANFLQVKCSGKPFVVRVPLIPGINDTNENLEQTAELVAGAENLVRVELLPYHKTAGAKYNMVQRHYDPGFDIERDVNKNTEPFEKRGIPVKVL